MASQAKDSKKSKQAEKHATDFVLQKFLLRARAIEQKQELLGKKMDELLKNIKLKKVYQKIVSQD